jgi:cytochrome P450
MKRPGIIELYITHNHRNILTTPFSSATTWALFALAKDLTIQTKLRNELLVVSTDNPTMEELHALPYLDAVVRETMRVYSPVPGTVRIAMKDDILPLNVPFVDRKGILRDSIR